MGGHIRRAGIHRKWRRKAPETCRRCGAQRVHADAGVQRPAGIYCEAYDCSLGFTYISQCSVDLLVTSYGLFHTTVFPELRPTGRAFFWFWGPQKELGAITCARTRTRPVDASGIVRFLWKLTGRRGQWGGVPVPVGARIGLQREVTTLVNATSPLCVS